MSPKEWPAEKLVSECLAQETRAWDELVRRFGPVIYGTIRKQLTRFGCASRGDLLEDAYQEVFLTLSRDRSLGRLGNADALPGYLAAVAVSKAVDAVRSTVRDGAYAEWSAAEDGAGTAREEGAGAERELACPHPNPRDDQEHRDIRDIVEKELLDLTAREALVVRLKWQHDMTLESIARELELPTGTVASVLRRARDMVRTRLQEKGIGG